MDQLHLAEFVGLPSALGWSRILLLPTAKPEQTCMLCLAVAGSEASAIGHEVAALVRARQISSDQTLYACVAEVNDLVIERNARLSVSAALIEADHGCWVVYDGVVSLRRQGKFGKVLASDELAIRVGSLQQGNVFVLATAAAGGMLDDIRSLFELGYQLTGVESSLERLIRTQPHQDVSAVVLVASGLLSASSTGQEGSLPVLPLPVAEPVPPSSGTAHHASASPPSRRYSWLKTSMARGRQVSRLLSELPWKHWIINRRYQVVVAIMVGVLIVVGVAMLVYSSSRQRAISEAQAAMEPYQQRFSAAQTLATTDPVGGRARIQELRSEVNEAAGAATNGVRATAFQSLSRELEEFERGLIGAVELTEVPIFLDLQTVLPNFVASLSDAIPGTAIYVDTAQRKAVVLTVASRETRVFDLSSLDTIKSVAMRSQDEAIILSNGLYALSLKPGSTPQQVKAAGDSNRDATLIGAYDNYVYVFNPEKRNIFRYVVRKDGYSDPIGWLLSPLGIPADTVHTMKVDGDVWLGTTDGKIKKFTSGRLTSFSIKDIDQNPEGSVELYTSETDQYLYALIANQRRTVVLTKDGQFVKQLKSSVFAGAVAVMADESTSRPYPISGSVVYEAVL